MIRTTQNCDNIVTVWMDCPTKPVNTCSTEFLHRLAEAIDQIERDRPAAVIFASAKSRSFCAGADLFELRAMSTEQIADFLARGQALFDRIAHLSTRTVAAINGDCLGGGFELALACQHRVAVDETAISIGLPEVKIGLIPAWGGTTRLPRLIGLRAALPILLAGKTMPPRKAMRAGMIDEVVPAESLVHAATRIALGPAPRRRLPIVDRAVAVVPFLRNRVLAVAQRKTMKLTHGNYPAPLALLRAVRAGYADGFAAGLAAERSEILHVIETSAGRNLLRLFFLRQAAKKQAAAQAGGTPIEVKHAAVIGGGTMGAGIVHSLIRAGIPVRLIEVSPSAVSAALGRIQRMLDEDVSAGRLTPLAARHTFNRVWPTTDWSGLRLADVVIEAVVETMDAKREVFARLDRLTRPTAVLASNTSSLQIADIAAATMHPQRVVGLHFFNPVPKMPLVEVVRTSQSDSASLATAVALAARIGKTPVLVKDSPGFVVNRTLIPYLHDALTMAGEGTSIESIDRAMKDWGMPMGPFELMDEIGLDVAGHVLDSLGGHDIQRGIGETLALAKQRGWLGKKSGRGFYVYPKTELNDELAHALGGGRDSFLENDAIQHRLLQPMVASAAAILAEGVVDSADSIDLAMVMGAGVAPFRGGITQMLPASKTIVDVPRHAA